MQDMVSQYIALFLAAGVAITDLVLNGKVDSSWQIAGALIAYAGVRQAVKMGLKR